MKIRLATMEDIPAISRLVYSLSAKYIASQFSEKGARNLLRSMELPAVEGYLKSGYRYHLAEDDRGYCQVTESLRTCSKSFQ